MDTTNLSACFIDATATNIDWREAFGEDCEGWRAFEAVECDECSELRVCNGYGEEHCCDLDPEGESDCEGVFYSEGPMMNYWYPVEVDDLDEAAKAIAYLPLCLVEFRDGSQGLALTGGGMDLTWEIAEAYITLGFLPPLEYCDLPRMAGPLREGWRNVVAACKRTAQITSDRAINRLHDLCRLEEENIAEEERRK